jgi:aspartyl-tRNA(Asn)/glutamyl-tRNA(Gln) amidotransferase subunit C
MSNKNPVTREQIAHIARLARLDLQGQELDAMLQHMDKIIDAVSTLAELDTTDVQSFSHGTEGVNNPDGPSLLRDDVVRPSLPVDQALSNAPAKGPDGFAVPAIHD